MQSLTHSPLSPFEKAPSVCSPEREAFAPRLLYLATSRHEGGLERSSVRLAALLKERGASVRYACHPGGLVEARCALNTIPTFPLRVRNSGDVWAATRLARLIHENQIEIVHVHSRRDYVPAVLGVRLARRMAERDGSGMAPRLLLHVHQIRTLGDSSPFSAWFFARGVDQVVAVSDPVRDRVLQGTWFPAELVQTIENGVDLAAYADPHGVEAAARRRAARGAWKIPHDAPVIGMIGCLGTKGQSALLRVVPRLLGTVPELRVVLAGPEKKRGQAEALRRQAARLGISDRVILPGVTEDVPCCMAAIDVLAHLPKDEAFGLTLAEAMAAGVPVVASDVGGCRTVVREGRTGYLVAHGDTAALAERLIALFDPCEGRGLRAALGAEGRLIAEKSLALETQIDRLVALYRGMLRPEGAGSSEKPFPS